MILLTTIVSGLVLAAVLYQVLEMWVIHRSSKGAPRRPVTGVDALVGTDAEVVEAFRRSGPDSPAIGRVRVGNESWQAELLDSSGRLATVGDQLHVVGAAGTLLKVTWR